MKLVPHEVYHVYNRGINRQMLFPEEKDYLYFLQLAQFKLIPFCDLLAYCLMPNHFHFLIQMNEVSLMPYKRKGREDVESKGDPLQDMCSFSHGLQQLLSIYAKGINKRYMRSGSLFTQNTRIKRTSSEYFTQDYALWCMMYIHNNPKAAGLVRSNEAWKYSSLREYLGWTDKPLCNLELGKEMFLMEQNGGFNFNQFQVPDHIIPKIF